MRGSAPPPRRSRRRCGRRAARWPPPRRATRRARSPRGPRPGRPCASAPRRAVCAEWMPSGSARALPRWFGFVTSVTQLDAARPRPYLNEPSFSRGVPAAARDPRERGTATVQAREQRNDKRARILDAAVKVFAERGYFSSTVAEIARAAGAARGAIYPYFKRKDDPLPRPVDDKMTQLPAEAKAALAEEGDAPPRLHRLIQL